MYDYNTTRSPLLLKEYGRHIQKLIEQLKKVESKSLRTQNAHAIVKLMEVINPNAESIQKRWDDLFILSDYQLDIDGLPLKPVKRISPYPTMVRLPSTEPIKYKYYGRHLTMLLKKIATLSAPKAQAAMLIAVGKLMRRFSSIWNNAYISNDKIIEEIKYMLPNNKDLDLEVIRTLSEDGVHGQKIKANHQTKSIALSKHKVFK